VFGALSNPGSIPTNWHSGTLGYSATSLNK
jgi:hypothetical protein